MRHKYLIWFGLSVFGLWIATPFVLQCLYPTDTGARGQFGDMFGAVNALFTGAALLGAVYAIRLQTEELGLQRDELRRSTEEFRKQNEILESQLTAAKAAQAAAEAKERLASMPFLRYRGGARGMKSDVFDFENVGGDIYDITVATEGGYVFDSLSRTDMWRSTEIARLDLKCPKGKPTTGTWAFSFHFNTKLGIRGSVRFEVDLTTGRAIKKDM